MKILTYLCVVFSLVLFTGGADAKSRGPSQTVSVVHSFNPWGNVPWGDARGTSKPRQVHRVSHQRVASHWKRHTAAVQSHSAGATGIVTVDSAAGPITVAKDFVVPIQGFIQDVVDKGFSGPVHCYARNGHVANSNHYTGHACDFAQTGWNRTQPIMYHVTELASKWGLRDGCTFSRADCGHIDNGVNIGWHPTKPTAVARTLKGYMQEHSL